jgi:hypothetical protein
MTYRVRAIVTDGVVTAPRYFHHTLKAMTSLSAFVGLLVLGFETLLAAFVASLGLFALVWLHERIWPSDVAPHTMIEHVDDALTDCALACVTLAAGYWLVGARVTALVVLAVCVITWAACHEHARP